MAGRPRRRARRARQNAGKARRNTPTERIRERNAWLSGDDLEGKDREYLRNELREEDWIDYYSESQILRMTKAQLKQKILQYRIDSAHDDIEGIEFPEGTEWEKRDRPTEHDFSEYDRIMYGIENPRARRNFKKKKAPRGGRGGRSLRQILLSAHQYAVEEVAPTMSDPNVLGPLVVDLERAIALTGGGARRNPKDDLGSIFRRRIAALRADLKEQDAEGSPTPRARSWMDMGQLQDGTIVQFFPADDLPVEAYVMEVSPGNFMGLGVHEDPALATDVDVVLASGHVVTLANAAVPLPPSWAKRGVVVARTLYREAQDVRVAQAALLSDGLTEEVLRASRRVPNAILVQVRDVSTGQVIADFLRGAAAPENDPRFEARKLVRSRLRRLGTSRWG